MALRLLIAILILAIPAELPGCGPFLPQALFYRTGGPEAPAAFIRGQLGILLPSYERFYQVIAYRYLSGVGLSDVEQRVVLAPPQTPDDNPAPTIAPNPWLQARNGVSGIAPLHELDPYRQVRKEGYFDTYLNCNDDAFVTAAASLKRVQGTGAVAGWIAAQDMVFADCSQGAAIPQPTSDPHLAADRAYQIASAKFYSEQYDAARQDFLAIAADVTSPWHGIAPYVAARCLIRSGKLADADAELQKIAADPTLARWHAPANGLLGYVRARLHPAERMHELALALVKPNSQTTIGQDLTDYRALFDKNIKPQPNDDLTEWIQSFQAGGAGAPEYWRATHSLPWLIAALQAAGPRDTGTPELIAAARAVKPDSPGFLTVNYHLVRLLQPDDARTLADRLLAGEMPISARNQFRSERMGLARDFEDFLRFAPRRPVAEMIDGVEPVDTNVDLLDGDSTDVLDQDVPLTLLKQASASALLPDATREQLRHVASIRALVLSDAPPFDDVFTLLNTPGLGPHLVPGYGRYTKEPNQIDPYRDNWWCSATAPPVTNTSAVRQAASNATPFLSAADREQAAAEWKKLESVATGPNWLTAQTLAYAQAHPQDPRVPEALYLAVRSTRYGCTDKETGDFSHRAFDLLHQRYPNSDWAKKTPYWFK